MLSPQYRPIVGGYERAAERLSAALVARGHRVTVIAERRRRAWPAREVREGVVIRRLPCLYQPRLHVVSSLLAFAWFLLWRGRRFDVWHVHQYGLHAALAAAMGKLLGRPVVLKLTSSAGEGIRNAVARSPLSPIVAALLRRVDAVVAMSPEIRDEALAFGIPKDRIERLGNGVDAHRFRPASSADRLAARVELGVVAAGLVVFVGRLSVEKNPDGLLTAWRAARPRMPSDWRLVIVGDGPMRKALMARIEADALGESVRLVGDRPDVERWLRAANIFVLTSHLEGLSNTTLEAMASGLPVVTTRVSGSAETVGEPAAGAVVDIGRMDQLADELVRLAADASLRERMGRAGRAVIEDRYSIDRVAEAYLALYRRLTSPPNAERRSA